MHINSLVTVILIWWMLWSKFTTSALALPRTKEYRTGSGEVVSNKNGLNPEPSCEELKAMWRLSKRQSRAAEITNEIPMYTDPFANNVWRPYYATSRSIGGMRMGRYHGTPIYGRVVHKVPLLHIPDLAERNRAFEELAKMYGSNPQQNEPRRRMTAFRLSGGGHIIPPQTGSFQHLKELIRTERARELQQLRMAEEIAARDAALKELGRSGYRKTQANYRDANYDDDIDGREDQQDDYVDRSGILAFPDILAPAAPAAHQQPDDARFIQDYGYTKDRRRTQRASYDDTSSLNSDFDGLML